MTVKYPGLYKQPPRLTLEMTLLDAMVAFGEGNPGALTVLTMTQKSIEKIDPQSTLGLIGPLSILDNLECYGSKIWVLYKDICGENLTNFIGVLRGNQLGIVNDHQITQAIEASLSRNPVNLDVESILNKVREKLTDFAKEETQ